MYEKNSKDWKLCVFLPNYTHSLNLITEKHMKFLSLIGICLMNQTNALEYCSSIGLVLP